MKSLKLGLNLVGRSEFFKKEMFGRSLHIIIEFSPQKIRVNFGNILEKYSSETYRLLGVECDRATGKISIIFLSRT